MSLRTWWAQRQERKRANRRAWHVEMTIPYEVRCTLHSGEVLSLTVVGYHDYYGGDADSKWHAEWKAARIIRSGLRHKGRYYPAAAFSVVDIVRGEEPA